MKRSITDYFRSAKWSETIINKRYTWQDHAMIRMIERNVFRDEVIEVLLGGECIEVYDDDTPFPSGLFFKTVENRPLHVVASYDETKAWIYIITIYEPDTINFSTDFRQRRN